MTEIEKIRNMFFYKGYSISGIKKETGFDRKTIRKTLFKSEWNDKPVNEKTRPSKLDSYKDVIDRWLKDDKQMRKKQRHTATRVFKRLKEEYGESVFNCSYRTVAIYVAEKKREIYGNNNSYLPLEHKPGEAQIDFGKAEFIESGKRYYGSYLNVSFPYSNGGFLQLFKGENFECLALGLKNIFEYIGGVPHRQWYDNMSTAVSKVLKHGDRKLTDSFIRFKEHYGYEAVFCNPASGNEKGNVENKVGYLRRNMLVPIPLFNNIKEYNKELLERCMNDLNREHYKKEKLIIDLFKEDVKALGPLPNTEFNACTYESVRTNAYAKFTLNKGRHTYSTMPRFAGSYVTICLLANEIHVIDEEMRIIVKHKRLYGDNKQEAMDWLPYLTQLSRRPAALKYTGIYDILPDPVKFWMEQKPRDKRSKALKLLAKLTENSDFDTAVNVVREAIEYDTFDIDSVEALFARYTNKLNELVLKELPASVPDMITLEPDVKQYDRTFLNQSDKGLHHANN
jgi:transposase